MNRKHTWSDTTVFQLYCMQGNTVFSKLFSVLPFLFKYHNNSKNSFRSTATVTVSCFKNWMGRFPNVLQTVPKTDRSSSHIPNTTSRTQFTTWVCFCQLTPCQLGHLSQLTQWSYRQVTSGLRKTWTPKGRPGSHSCPSSFNISVFSLLLSEPGRQQAVKNKRNKET